MSLGKMFLSAVLAEGTVSSLLQYGSVEHLFTANEIESYEFVRGFVKKYSALPSPETIQNHLKTSLVPHKEPSGYYFDLMQARHVEQQLKKGMKQASDLLSPANMDPEAALAAIVTVAMDLASKKQQKQIIDFRRDLVHRASGSG
jgi:hypothetical protein